MFKNQYRSPKHIAFHVVSLVLLFILSVPEARAQNDPVVSLLVNADIVTMNPEQPSAEAMAVAGDRILIVGSEAEVRAGIESYEKFYDLQGRTVVPGFIETHDHLFMSSNILAVMDVSPFTTPTLAGALEKIRVAEPDEEGWIVAFGADQTLYKEGKGPTRDVLDPIFPNVPVVVFHVSGHGGFANSEAFRLAGIDKTTPDPQGGYFEKDSSGELTGYISGQPALFMLIDFPVPTVELAREAAALRAKEGITTSSEFALMSPFLLDLVREATSDPAFPVRVIGGLFVTVPGFDELATRLSNYETDLFHIPFIKTWTDGSPQGGTAHFTEGYHDPDFGQSGERGSQEYFNEQVLKMYKLGLWPAIHANGDGAVDVALNAIEYAQKETGINGIRPQIIHVQLTRPEQIERMARLGAYPTFFTTHIYYWGDLHYEHTVGPDRAQRLSAMGDAFRAGVKPSMHNDPPVTPVDPLFNMWIAVNRKTSSGRIIGPNQAITAQEALEAYTINAAYQFGMENNAGSLEPGKLCDFVVLDRNPLKVNPDEIRNIRVLATVRGGQITYLSPGHYDRIDPPGREN